jgi:hypothetical protein
MARHVVVDLALIFDTPPKAAEPDRLSPDMLVKLREDLTKAGLEMKEGSAVDAKLTELRSSYEPFANSLAQFLQFRLPPIVPDKITVDNWQTSAWMRRIAGIGKLASLVDGDEHFD